MAHRSQSFTVVPTLAPEIDGLVSVVIPAWNEAITIPELLRRIRAALEPIATRVEILVVVPVPEDPTARRARACDARVILQKRPGYGGALKEGLLAARGEYVVTLDADLSHPPEAIPQLLSRRDDAEIVVGSRYVAGGTAKMAKGRALLSVVLNAVYRRLLAVPVLDMSSGFRVYHRKALDELSLQSEKYDVLEEILVKSYSLGWKVVEVPFDYQPRVAGESHASVVGFAPHFLRTLLRLWRMRNSSRSADYDSRAYDSLVLPQRYWQRRRFELVNAMAGEATRRLDIGCGSSRIIQSRPDAVGLDIETSKLRFLRRTNPLLVRATCLRLPFANGSIESVVSSQMIEQLPHDSGLFGEMNRVLKPGGVLVIATPDSGRVAWRLIEWFYKRLAPHAKGTEKVTRYSRYTLMEALAGAGFAIVQYRYIFGVELIVECVKREPYEQPAARSKR